MPTHLKTCEKVQAAGALGTIINQIANNGSKNPLPREIDVSGVKSEESAIGSKRIKREEPPRFTTLSSQFVMSTKAAEQVHFLLIRALIACNIPFNVLRNSRWKSFISHLRPAYAQISRETMDTRILQTEHARIWQVMMSDIRESDGGYTLQLDGWSDKKRRSLYGYTIGKIGEYPRVLDVLDISKEFHSSEKLVDVTSNVMQKWMENMNKVVAVTTDSPNVMVRFRRLLQEKYDHLLVFPCFAHALNLFVKSIVSFSFSSALIKQCGVIVHFFRASHYWNAWLNSYKAKHSISHGLSKFCETRWYSIVHFLRSLEDLEPGLMEAQRHSELVQSEHKLPEQVSSLIKRQLFGNVQVLVSVLEPILDALAAMEKSTASLADCLLQLFRVAARLRKIKKEAGSNYSLFLGQVVDAFNKRYEQYANPTYAVALFLHPMGPELILPDRNEFTNGYSYTADILPGMLSIAKRWGYSGSDAEALVDLGELYLDGAAPFDNRSRCQYDALTYWEQIDERKGGPLRSLAVKLFKIKPTSVEVERLFSHLGAIHTDSRSSLKPEKLKMLAQSKLFYVAEDAKVEASDQSIFAAYDHQSGFQSSTLSGETESPSCSNQSSVVSSDSSSNSQSASATSSFSNSSGPDNDEAFTASDEAGTDLAIAQTETGIEIDVARILEGMTEHAKFTPEDVVDLSHPLATGISSEEAAQQEEMIKEEGGRKPQDDYDWSVEALLAKKSK